MPKRALVGILADIFHQKYCSLHCSNEELYDATTCSYLRDNKFHRRPPVAIVASSIAENLTQLVIS